MTCKHKDCDGSKGQNLGHEFEDELLRECPVFLTTPASWTALQLYSHYKNGYLPVAGGILDQTSHFNRAMEIIEGMIHEHQSKQKEE